MPSQNWAEAIKFVMSQAQDGFRLSEVRGLNKAAAEWLINKGKLHSTPLKNGDWLVNK